MIHRRAASLRTTLLVPLLWMWLVPGMIATLSAFWLTGKAAQKAFDRVLKDDALALAAEIRWEGSDPTFRLDPTRAASLVFDSMSPTSFTVRTSAGRVLVGNAQLDLPIGAELHRGSEPLFYDSLTDWGLLRVVALRTHREKTTENVWVIVGEAQTKRDQISSELASAIFLPAAGVGFILVPLLFLGIRRGLAPARELVEAVTARGIDDLSPLSLDGVPDELRGLVERLNDLFARLTEAIAHERRFIADAAHQLRTPTAGIKLLAEDLLKSLRQTPQSPPNAEVLGELHAAAIRTSDLVRQLLMLARAERDPSLIERTTFDAVSLVQQTCERWQQVEAAHDKQLIMASELIDAAPCWVHSNATLLEEALGNLLHNALQYGGPNIQVGLACDADRFRIDVLDNGPELNAETKANFFTPFWRGDSSGTQGTGLGLAIAQRTVLSLGGELVFRSRPEVPGNCFTITLPHPSAAPRPPAGRDQGH